MGQSVAIVLFTDPDQAVDQQGASSDFEGIWKVPRHNLQITMDTKLAVLSGLNHSCEFSFIE